MKDAPSNKAATNQEQTTDIDPNGDLLIVCGGRKLRASSHILSLISPPFKALLGPRFREGNVERSSITPLTLDLPDDDPSAMAVFLKITHFSPSVHSPGGLAMQGQDYCSLINNVAVLADKYCCKHIMHYPCEEVAHRKSLPSATMKQLDVVARTAYLVRHTHLFHTVVTLMVKRSFAEIQAVSSPKLKGKPTMWNRI